MRKKRTAGIVLVLLLMFSFFVPEPPVFSVDGGTAVEQVADGGEEQKDPLAVPGFPMPPATFRQAPFPRTSRTCPAATPNDPLLRPPIFS